MNLMLHRPVGLIIDEGGPCHPQGQGPEGSLSLVHVMPASRGQDPAIGGQAPAESLLPLILPW